VVTVRVGSAFFCDDVRIEKSEKNIYVGVYTGTMIMQNNEEAVFLRLVTTVMSDGAARGNFEVRVRIDDKEIASAENTYEIRQRGIGHFIFPPLQVGPLERECALIVEMQLDGRGWEEANYTSITFATMQSPVH